MSVEALSKLLVCHFPKSHSRANISFIKTIIKIPQPSFGIITWTDITCGICTNRWIHFLPHMQEESNFIGKRPRTNRSSSQQMWNINKQHPIWPSFATRLANSSVGQHKKNRYLSFFQPPNLRWYVVQIIYHGTGTRTRIRALMVILNEEKARRGSTGWKQYASQADFQYQYHIQRRLIAI